MNYSMRYFRSMRSLFVVSLAGLISSTSRAVITAEAATITLEPSWVSNSDSNFVITSTLRVVNNSIAGSEYNNAFPIDLYSSNMIEFVLQPPPGADEMRLSSSAPGEAIEVIFRASLVEGANVDKCQNNTSNADDEDNVFNQLLIGGFFKASVTGRDADMLSQAFAWERSYVSIEKYGCVVESRLFFQPTVEDGLILANVEKISWVAQYEVDAIGGMADETASLYRLESEDGTSGDTTINGGDVSFDITDDEAENADEENQESSMESMGPTAADEGSTSDGSQVIVGFIHAISMFLVFASFTGI